MLKTLKAKFNKHLNFLFQRNLRKTPFEPIQSHSFLQGSTIGKNKHDQLTKKKHKKKCAQIYSLEGVESAKNKKILMGRPS